MCVLGYCVPNKGLHPLRRESGYPLTKKGVTFTVTPFMFYRFYEHPANVLRSFCIVNPKSA